MSQTRLFNYLHARIPVPSGLNRVNWRCFLKDDDLPIVCEYLHYGFPLNIDYVNFSFVYLFGVLRRFQHCTGHVMTGSWKGRGNQYIEFVRVLYCKLPTNGKQLPAFPLKAMAGIEPWPQRWEARVLPLCHRGPHFSFVEKVTNHTST